MINTSVKLLYNDLSTGSWTRYIWSTIDVAQLVRDLHSQGSDATPCNLFLFNIVLSEACIYYDHPDNIELSIKFSEEAERFCEAGAGITSIANAQALMCQAVRHQMMGNDRLGEARMLRALDMQKELEQSSVYEIFDDAHKKSKQEIITRIGWAMFNGYAKSAAVLLWPVKSIPSRELVLERDCDRAATDTWSPYPVDSTTRSDHPRCFFRADIELSKIFARITQVLIDDSLDFHRFEPELESICQKLNTWKRNLPICQALCQNAPADYFAQHAEFHWAKIMIHTFVQKQKTRLLSEGLKVNSDKLTKCVTKSDAIYSAQQIAIINHDYMEQFGTRYMQIFMIQPTAIALFLLLTDLDSIENQQSFTVLSEAAAANARLWKLCEAILTMVRQTAEALRVTLPPRAERFLHQDAGTANLHGRNKFEGDYPNFLLASGQIQESEKVAAVISDLSKMYDALNLNSENPALTKTA
ncbi:hypothetical protein LTR05_005973 [Lithohypha guttulata]|uniref:Transcription factor domain-containing protein n=1 Tax=Lithohypha guttulata TaxID=1690604 RepID=A0AAN7SWM9_9EURO|nr:hypothetical protein LTR05_005973 [Lithohypha guttulata]